MKPFPIRRRFAPAVLVAAAAFLFAAKPFAQVKTETTGKTGEPAHVVEVERGEVVHLCGNSMVVKMESGEIRHFPDIPESARITVDGKELGIHDLKVGMKLERTITTTTTPRIVTTVQTVTGKVWQVVPPDSVILTLENGENQTFSIPKGQKFMVGDREVDAAGLKKGMRLSATKIVEAPEDVVTRERKVAGTMPPPPAAPPADRPILVAKEPAAPAPAAKKPAPPSEPAPGKQP
jgi:hypothetical protein